MQISAICPIVLGNFEWCEERSPCDHKGSYLIPKSLPRAFRLVNLSPDLPMFLADCLYHFCLTMMIEGLQLNSAKRELPVLSTVNLNCVLYVSSLFWLFQIGLYFDEAMCNLVNLKYVQILLQASMHLNGRSLKVIFFLHYYSFIVFSKMNKQ